MLLVDAISQAPQYGWGATRTIAVLAASVGLLVSFLAIEKRAEWPILPLSIFRLRTLAGANIAAAAAGRQLLRLPLRRHPVHAGGAALQRAPGRACVAGGVADLARARRRLPALVTRIGAKPVMAVGMTLIGAGVLWATQVPVHGHFVGNLLGPFIVAGAGTAFAFIPISIAALAGIKEHQAGLASGLLNTSQQLGGAIGIAIASSVAASHTNALLHAGTRCTRGAHRRLPARASGYSARSRCSPSR